MAYPVASVGTIGDGGTVITSTVGAASDTFAAQPWRTHVRIETTGTATSATFTSYAVSRYGYTVANKVQAIGTTEIREFLVTDEYINPNTGLATVALTPTTGVKVTVVN